MGQQHAAQKAEANLPIKAPPTSQAHLPAPGAVHPLLHLQRTAGNRAVQSLIQTKLKIGQPGDRYEQEADRVADQVMRLPVPGVQRQVRPEEEEAESLQLKSLSGQVAGHLVQRKCAACASGQGLCPNCAEEENEIQRKPLASTITPLIQRQDDEELEDEEETLRPKAASGQTPAVTAGVQARIQSLQGGGQPLPDAPRIFFESRFKTDLSQVRTHTGAAATQTAQAVNARAFTVGQDVVFGAGQYAPETNEGRRLLAHELTHVVQQTSPPSPSTATLQRQATSPEPAAEAAESAAEMATPGLIVEDEATELQPGQMTKSDFLTRLRSEVCRTAEAAMAGTGRTTADCPYLDYWFDYYSQKDSQHVERAIRRYAPETRGVTTAQDYIPPITERVRQGVENWVSTGEITGVPEGVRTDLPGAASPEAGEGPAAPPGNVQFKARNGGARDASNPRAIQARLGSGRSLEGGVKSRMESAFGRSFSHVRVHTDAGAAALSSRYNARAFTMGEHVAFGAREYQPGTLVGDAIIAHELAHVVQQKNANTSISLKQIGDTGYSALEDDADLSAVSAIVSLWSGAKASLKGLVQNAMPRLKTGLRLQSCRRTVKKCPPGKSWQVQTRLGEPLAIGTGPVCWCVWKCRPAPPPPPPPNSVSCATDPRTGRSLCEGPPPVEEKDWPEQRRKATEQPSWKLGPGGHFTPLGGQALCGCIPLDVEGGEKTDAPLIKVGIQATDLASFTRGRSRTRSPAKTAPSRTRGRSRTRSPAKTAPSRPTTPTDRTRSTTSGSGGAPPGRTGPSGPTGPTPTPKIPGRVRSRINIRKGIVRDKSPVPGRQNLEGRGMDYAWRRHGGSGPKSKSQFSISRSEVEGLLRSRQVIDAPVRRSGTTNNFIREVDVGKVTGHLPENKGKTPTSVITVITDEFGNLVNTFPGTLGRRATLPGPAGGTPSPSSTRGSP